MADEPIDGILKILELHEARIDILQKVLDSNHVEWQRDTGNDIRLEAQIESLLSLVKELAARAGVSESHVATCFRERYLRIQEERLLEYEKADPGLAAQIDNRVEGDIPTNQKIRPLFPET